MSTDLPKYDVWALGAGAGVMICDMVSWHWQLVPGALQSSGANGKRKVFAKSPRTVEHEHVMTVISVQGTSCVLRVYCVPLTSPFRISDLVPSYL